MIMLPTALGVGVLVTALALTLGYAFARARPATLRARRIVRATAAREAARVPAISTGERAAAKLNAFYEAIGLGNADARHSLGDKLAQAGINTPTAVALYQAALLVAPTMGALAGYLVAPMLLDSADGLRRIFVAAFGLAIGAAAPRLWLSNRVKKRQREVSRALPDALDLYVICAEAGLSLDAAMARVARELKLSSPALAEELRLTAIELGFLPNRHEAFSNLLKRVPLPAFRALVAMFQQTERYGTPLADALRMLAAEFRTRAMLRAEAKAAQLPAVLTVPMILFVLPPLFIVLVGPAIIQVMGAG